MSAVIATGAPPRVAKPWYKILYVQVLIAILIGILLFRPAGLLGRFAAEKV